MAHEKLRPEYLFDEEKIAQLKQLAPECFEDGKINFTTLSQNLGDWRQDEEDPELEHFGLFWPGKHDARKAAAIPPEGTLEPVWGDGLKADGTPDTDGVNDSKNIFIEGENLEVLKLLQKSYAGKIKMIYIDPPYNTGNDFVYDDDFTEPLQEYLRRTGQVDEEGRAMTTNKRSDGRFHSKWLSMMYPRLRLARNLLREDGVIFVSIDDNEVHNLRAIMNEIFGEENYISEIVWEKMYTTKNDSTKVSDCHEYIILFAKNNDYDNIRLLPRTKSMDERYKNPDNDPRGPWKPIPLYAKGERKNGRYEVKSPTGMSFWPEPNKHWLYREEDTLKMIADNRISFGKDGNSQPNVKRFLTEVQQGIKARTLWKYDEVGSNDSAKKELKELYNSNQIPFDFPKPITLLERIIQISCFENTTDNIILDFFAGSGTTCHASFLSSIKNISKSKFIGIQIPEQIEENTDASNLGFNSISEVTNNRLKRAIQKIKTEYQNQLIEKNIDLGFKALSLKHSNYKPWKNYNGTSIPELELSFDEFNQSPLREGYTEDGLLTEIMLLEGFTLCSTITTLSEIKTNILRKVTSEYCDHSLLVCLDKEIAKATVAGLQLGENDIFICLDSAISTEDKLRLSDKGLIKTI